jgi:hypothetical protein
VKAINAHNNTILRKKFVERLVIEIDCFNELNAAPAQIAVGRVVADRQDVRPWTRFECSSSSQHYTLETFFLTRFVSNWSLVFWNSVVSMTPRLFRDATSWFKLYRLEIQQWLNFSNHQSLTGGAWPRSFYELFCTVPIRLCGSVPAWVPH